MDDLPAKAFPYVGALQLFHQLHSKTTSCRNYCKVTDKQGNSLSLCVSITVCVSSCCCVLPVRVHAPMYQNMFVLLDDWAHPVI